MNPPLQSPSKLIQAASTFPENLPPVHFENEGHLETFIREKNIPLELWGKKQYRTVKQLWKSLTTEKVSIVNPGVDHPPTLIVHPSVVYIQHLPKGPGAEVLEIYEKQQIMPDRTKIVRNFRGIAETRFKDELALDGARRCLAEELGPTERRFLDYNGLKVCMSEVLRKPSDKYYGFAAVFLREIFRDDVDESFLHDIFIEFNPRTGITTEFEWRPHKTLVSSTLR